MTLSLHAGILGPIKLCNTLQQTGLKTLQETGLKRLQEMCYKEASEMYYKDAARDVLQGGIYIKHLQLSTLSAPLTPCLCHVCGNVLHAGLVLEHDTCCVMCNVLHAGLMLEHTARAAQFGL